MGDPNAAVAIKQSGSKSDNLKLESEEAEEAEELDDEVVALASAAQIESPVALAAFMR